VRCITDEQFVTLFLITFRRFARPYDVLEKLVERFEFVASKMSSDPLLCRFGQMKCVSSSRHSMSVL